MDTAFDILSIALVFRDLFFRAVEEGSCLDSFGVFVDCMHKCNYNSTFGKATTPEVLCDREPGLGLSGQF